MVAQATSPTLKNHEGSTACPPTIRLSAGDLRPPSLHCGMINKKKYENIVKMKAVKSVLRKAMVISGLMWIMSYNPAVLLLLVMIVYFIFCLVVENMEEEDLEFVAEMAMMRWKEMKGKLGAAFDYASGKFISIAIICFQDMGVIGDVDDDELVDAEEERLCDDEEKEDDGEWALID